MPPQVVDDGASRTDGKRQPVAAIGLQRDYAEVGQQGLGRPVKVEGVSLQGGDARAGLLGQRVLLLRDEQLGGRQPR